MDTKSLVPDNIRKLLESALVSDIVLGVLWCKNTKGKDWCERNFNFTTTYEQGLGGVPSNFITHRSVGHPEKLILFEGWGVLIGSICLQAIKTKFYVGTTKEIVYEEIS